MSVTPWNEISLRCVALGQVSLIIIIPSLCNASSLAVLLINYRAKSEKSLVHGLNRDLIALNGKISLMLKLINVQIYKQLKNIERLFYHLLETFSFYTRNDNVPNLRSKSSILKSILESVMISEEMETKDNVDFKQSAILKNHRYHLELLTSSERLKDCWRRKNLRIDITLERLKRFEERSIFNDNFKIIKDF